MKQLLSILLLSICLYAEATFDQVQSMIDKQQYKQAVLSLTVIADNHPTSSKVQYALAQAQAGLGNLPAAKDALDKAIAINPKLDFVPAKQVEELSKTINASRVIKPIESDSHWVLWILLAVGTSFVVAYFIRSKKPDEPTTPDIKPTYTTAPKPIKPMDYDDITPTSSTNKPFISRYEPMAEPVRTSRPAEVHYHNHGNSNSGSDLLSTVAVAGLTSAAVSYAMNHDDSVEQPTHSYQPEPVVSESWNDSYESKSTSSSWNDDSSSSSDSWSDSSSDSSSSWND